MPPTQAQRVIDCLKSGPKTVAELVRLTGMTSPSAARACFNLVELEVVARIDGGRKQPGTYALRADRAAYEPVRNGDAYARAEEAYFSARKAGRQPNEIALDLKLSTTAARTFEDAYRSRTTSGFQADSSCPKFAEDGKHLDAVAETGRRFPFILLDRRSPQGPAVCWPGARA
jgi:hypothetical protein